MNATDLEIKARRILENACGSMKSPDARNIIEGCYRYLANNISNKEEITVEDELLGYLCRNCYISAWEDSIRNL